MKIKRDYNGEYFAEGYEQHRFSSEADAETAAELAFDRHLDLLEQESRYRRAAERAKERAQ